MDSKEQLLRWAEHYVKHRDLTHRTIVSIKKDSEGYDIVIEHKHKKQYVTIVPRLSDQELDTLTKVKDIEQLLVVVLNTQSNLDLIVKHWKTLSDQEFISFAFVNPETIPEEKWIINPNIHAKVCDISTLKSGLQSLFEGISAVREN